MKCGLIWARSARSSASMARVRWCASSASSTWPETHAAVSSVARTSAAEGGLRQVRRERTHDGVVTHQGNNHRTADRAVRIAAAQGISAEHGGATGAQDLLGVCDGLVGVRPAGALPGQRAVGVDERDRRRTQQESQVPSRPLGSVRSQAFAQVPRRRRRRVQSAEGGVRGVVAQQSPAASRGAGAASRARPPDRLRRVPVGQPPGPGAHWSQGISTSRRVAGGPVGPVARVSVGRVQPRPRRRSDPRPAGPGPPAGRARSGSPRSRAGGWPRGVGDRCQSGLPWHHNDAIMLPWISRRTSTDSATSSRWRPSRVARMPGPWPSGSPPRSSRRCG